MQAGGTTGSSDLHESWSSRFGFLMATIGFAVGLGNIWRFPYMTGENGGAAFVLVYLFCAFAIGIPILIAELLIGRRGQRSPPAAMRAIAEAEGRSRHWQWVGGMNLLAAFVIGLSYCVVIGWVLLYLWKALLTGFSGIDAAAARAEFDGLLHDTPTMVLWTWIGLVLTGAIIYAGVRKGIERAVTVMMPALFLLLLVLAAFNIVSGGFPAALDYLFRADFSKITASVWLAAVGQAFFSIGVAMAGMMTYGAYLPKSVSIVRSAWLIIVADTMVALLAGLVIFPVIFKFGLDPQGGPGLIFQTLPVAFAQMPGGHLFGVLFFVLLSFAGITSMVGLIEALTAWLEEHRGFARHRSALLVLAAIAILSLLSILSYSEFSEWRVAGKNLNAILDYLANQVLLPLGGLLIAVFAGWQMSRDSTREELDLPDGRVFGLWRILIRYPVPVAVLLILLLGVGS
ncbi:MAG: sodium-dependent transporter [Gammaproteobacteria bacterium]|jgi:NSS family neurotransmitter:Na+ symporter|nr:sodium-dependent transporter [Gammaproteobacteria bacterium]MBK6584325.1 sodium-dependent transporter [Gammaproteobacteria bacterium]MBK7168431.1 sodium-dependent transporter [Gammaproteobacteria bacterium]MBK7520786.1 sodium-dependent transporter [Gammaproteobacteria bacterium]MBK7727970.1 sodium-dependent transporter [Gammaproteobacteria bacterium]